MKMIAKFLNLNYKSLQCFIMDRNSPSLFLVWCLLYNLTRQVIVIYCKFSLHLILVYASL